jgi:hypothetical protein
LVLTRDATGPHAPPRQLRPLMLDDVIIEILDDDRSDDFYSGSDGI